MIIVFKTLRGNPREDRDGLFSQEKGLEWPQATAGKTEVGDEEEWFDSEGVKQAAQKSGRVSICGNVQEQFGWTLGWAGLIRDDPVLSSGLD